MLNRITNSCTLFSEKKAFCIKDKFYSYKEFAAKISSIRNAIESKAIHNSFIGILTYDDIETYASIFAAMYSGNGFIPLNPRNPIDRNLEIIQQSNIKFILTSKSEEKYFSSSLTTSLFLIETHSLIETIINLKVPQIKETDILCMLFTSGSTGKPKGVPYNLRNINSTLDSVFSLGYEINENDRFLQMFEFTFDMSLLSYLTALSIGACVFTVPENVIKYMHAFKLMDKYQITFAAMVPSTLAYMRPFFSELRFDNLKYSVLGGEPFYIDLAKEWAKCIPNAQIVNISGPTEITMACMGYNLSKDFSKNKTHNGILSFGKAWKNTTAVVFDENLNPTLPNIQGELCFAGEHVMEGYWKNQEKNKDVFFDFNYKGNIMKFYRTGDMAFIDENGYFMSCGRKDHQYKIQGFKVELGDIEANTREFTGIVNVAAIVTANDNNILEISLFVENYEADTKNILNYLKTKLPHYMIPSNIFVLKQLPTNMNGKIDRKELHNILQKNKK